MSANSWYKTIFFAFNFLIISVLSIFIFWPFLIPLALALVIAVLIYPVYRQIEHYVKSKNLAAGLSIVLLIALIITPLALVANQIIREAQNLYETVSSGNTVSLDLLNIKVDAVVHKYAPDFNFDAKQYLAGFTSWIVDKLGGLFSGTLDFILKLFLALIALFYFLKDGEEFKKQIIALSPLSDDKDKFISTSIKSSIKSVLLGSLAIAVVQGILTGVGFTLFGVPNSTLWGTVAGICSLVPGIGTALVWIPAVGYLYFYGSSGIWIVQLVWSIFFVGLIDNFLTPLIINKGVNVHPLFVLFQSLVVSNSSALKDSSLAHLSLVYCLYLSVLQRLQNQISFNLKD
jgi:predicted PurR-regulated permease PerM